MLIPPLLADIGRFQLSRFNVHIQTMISPGYQLRKSWICLIRLALCIGPREEVFHNKRDMPMRILGCLFKTL
ncbi:hypothetical protein AI27_04215 [Sphingomonas sp. BHC-A]|uniref:Uncharacterized protein n=2 Tax=Sphingobium indicum TaxID=332055 RepID=A0A8E0WPK4_9SPHN|nr:hypothetical protein SIDU_12950 [Sphingobium indicum B90A]EPR16865.1 hypothetical protein M527_19230 [Sphingobium indicum IP26]EQA97577.1 hypothetical protein L286_22460 [Sphingobium sp. HDIP04]KER35126.1 hypothetical protein AL00_17685 [Sphingobium indicum F2]KEZ00393.1 hypothetical protein AI27_04215 [Sphingomonas sp. BHC-A]